MWLFFGENTDKFVENSNTTASKKLEQLVIAVTWLYNVDKVFSLRPRDTSNTTELIQKRIAGVNEIEQLNTIDSQLVHLSFMQRSNVTVLSSDIYRSNYTTQFRLYCLWSCCELNLKYEQCCRDEINLMDGWMDVDLKKLFSKASSTASKTRKYDNDNLWCWILNRHDSPVWL